MKYIFFKFKNSKPDKTSTEYSLKKNSYRQEYRIIKFYWKKEIKKVLPEYSQITMVDTVVEPPDGYENSNLLF